MHSFPDRCEPSRAARPAGWRLGVAGALLLGGLALSGCASVRERLPDVPSIGSLVTPYRIDIQQGNVVTREQAQALKPGMPRAQVADILGSPLLTSVFHGDRWDYVFTLRRQGQPLQERKLTVFFKGEVMERIESDELPTEAEFVATLDTQRRLEKVPVLQATDAQLKAFQERNQANNPVPAPLAPATINFPPLEPAR
jgi:outer membrane protein assembly factor BamE